MRNITFSKYAWDDYLSWIKNDQKKLKKINSLIEEITRTPFKGSGKPEPLKFKLAGFWSRRIDIENRLVYSVKSDKILIISCKGHY